MKKNSAIKILLFVGLLAGLLSCSLVSSAAVTSEEAYFPMPAEEGLGLMNCEGEWVVEPMEKGIIPGMMVDGTAPVMDMMMDSWGVMNADGEYLIEESFRRIFPFSEGLALVHLEDTIRFIDQTGSFAFDAEFPLTALPISRFGSGLANVPLEVRGMGISATVESMIYIDEEGSQALGPYNSAGSFSNGYASVSTSEDGEHFSGYIDNQGEFVLQFSRDEHLFPAGEYAEGLFPVRDMDADSYCNIGFMNIDKEWVIDPQFCRVGRFSDGLAAAAGEPENNFFEYGFINKKGKYEIRPDYLMDSPPEFRGGCARVNWDYYNGYGLIDLNGGMIYEFEH